MGRIWLTVQPYAARSQNPNGGGAYGGTGPGSSWTPPVFWHGSFSVPFVAPWMLTIGETRSLLPFEFPAACTRTIWPVSLPAKVPRVRVRGGGRGRGSTRPEDAARSTPRR